MTTLHHHRKNSSASNTAKRNAFILAMFLSLFFAQVSLAQTIKGNISGINHEPLFGATVSIKGINTGTTTDTGGNFSIKAKNGDVLNISYTGYKTKEIKLADENYVAVSLSASINLDEIIVTGYSSQKVKEITGSIASVKPTDLVAVPAGQVEPMLQGRVAGLTVINSAEPGAPSQVYLHGIAILEM